MTRVQTCIATLTAAALTCLLTGCRVHTSKNGKDDNVNISTPFGGMHVNTHDHADTSSIGLTAYPGATPLKEENGKESKSANIDMSFGDFHLGVNATTFRTNDDPGKVLAFYRKDLARYGDVIECRNNTPIGQPTHTAQGLTCNDKDDSGRSNSFSLHGTLNSNNIADGKDIELRAGSRQHQHIVGIDQKDGFTKIGLVLLDLPSHTDGKNGKEVE